MPLSVLNKYLAISLTLHIAVAIFATGYGMLVKKNEVKDSSKSINVKIITLDEKPKRKKVTAIVKNQRSDLKHKNNKVASLKFSSEKSKNRDVKSAAPPPWKKLNIKEKKAINKSYKRKKIKKEKKQSELVAEEPIPLNTKDRRYSDYFAFIKEKIFEKWTYPDDALKSGMFGRLKLKFTINEDGELIKIMIVTSSGHNLLDEEALLAVKKASPYGAIPTNIRKKALPIVVTFNYFPTYGSASR